LACDITPKKLSFLPHFSQKSSYAFRIFSKFALVTGPRFVAKAKTNLASHVKPFDRQVSEEALVRWSLINPHIPVTPLAGYFPACLCGSTLTL
jgi:hypothetical protein